MDSVIKTEYRGIEITYFECSDKWECMLGSKSWTRESLAELKKRIDAWIKAESNFERFRILKIIPNTWGKSAPRGKVYTVTSITEDGDWWVTDESTRSKLSAKELGLYCADTPSNRDILERANALDAQSKALVRQADELTKACTPATLTKETTNA